MIYNHDCQDSFSKMFQSIFRIQVQNQDTQTIDVILKPLFLVIQAGKGYTTVQLQDSLFNDDLTYSFFLLIVYKTYTQFLLQDIFTYGLHGYIFGIPHHNQGIFLFLKSIHNNAISFNEEFKLKFHIFMDNKLFSLSIKAYEKYIRLIL